MSRLIALILLLFASVAQYCYAADDSLRQYVHKLISDGNELFQNKSITRSQRDEAAIRLLNKNLDLAWMARYTVGRYRTKLSEEKMGQFITAYAQSTIRIYMGLAEKYSDEKVELTSIKQVSNDAFLVATVIVKPNTSIKIDYLVRKVQNAEESNWKVFDVVAEGVSIIASQQAEFNSVISASGIDVLIEQLKDKRKSD